MITGTPGMSGSTSRTPQITPRMPMNGLMSPTRRARSGSITNRNATATVPARPKPATKPFCPSS